MRAATTSSKHSIRSVWCLRTFLLLPCAFLPTNHRFQPPLPPSFVPPPTHPHKQNRGYHLTSHLPPPNHSLKPSTSHELIIIIIIFFLCSHTSCWPHLTNHPTQGFELTPCVFVHLKSKHDGGNSAMDRMKILNFIWVSRKRGRELKKTCSQLLLTDSDPVFA